MIANRIQMYVSYGLDLLSQHVIQTLQRKSLHCLTGGYKLENIFGLPSLKETNSFNCGQHYFVLQYDCLGGFNYLLLWLHVLGLCYLNTGNIQSAALVSSCYRQ